MSRPACQGGGHAGPPGSWQHLLPTAQSGVQSFEARFCRLPSAFASRFEKQVFATCCRMGLFFCACALAAITKPRVGCSRYCWKLGGAPRGGRASLPVLPPCLRLEEPAAGTALTESLRVGWRWVKGNRSRLPRLPCACSGQHRCLALCTGLPALCAGFYAPVNVMLACLSVTCIACDTLNDAVGLCHSPLRHYHIPWSMGWVRLSAQWVRLP